ncbi:MAG TPA: hypothetical protein VGO22_15440 [Pseudorhizobium sp.]|jgi:superfamily II helicase|nr:hypothetical protein [Pseudorhizobium sp.]
MPAGANISDKGLAVFAFAVYHQLEGGTRLREIVTDDGAAHRADAEAVEELQALGMLETDGNRLSFTDQGEVMLNSMIGSMRQAASEPSSDTR